MANLTGPTIAAAGPTSVFYSTPFPHKPGTKARDTDGNEYVFCDFSTNMYYGCLAQIDSQYTAAPLLGTALRAYRVGVVCSGKASSEPGDHPTSNHGGWVQIYGVHTAVQTGATSDGFVSDSTVAYVCIPQTSVGTPSGVLALITAANAGTSIAQSSIDANQIYGMWLVNFAEVTDLTTWPGSSAASGPTSRNEKDATSGAATSAFIGQTYSCFLNYPYVTGITVPLSAATS